MSEQDSGEIGAAGTGGYFAPEPDATRIEAVPRRRVTLRRLFVGIAACIAALVVMDALIAPSFAPPKAYVRNYRLPRVAPTASIADYASAIDLAARVPGHAPIAVFLGASPTYGHRIRDARNTFPYAYASQATSAGEPVQSFNLATNGQFVGDYLVIAKRLAPDADAVFVQLTYHTFSKTARKGARIRYPELPSMLDVPLSAGDAAALGVPASRGSARERTPSAVSAFAGRYWTLWRQRDLIDTRLFGGSPRTALASWVRRLTSADPSTSTAPATSTVLPADSADDGFASFDDLAPGQQMIVLSRYSEQSSFTIDPKDAEVLLLDRLAAYLQSQHEQAVFYMSPVNEDVIRAYGLIDPAKYRTNLTVLSGVLKKHGFTLIDHNLDATPLPRADFADISHTTDAGGQAFAALLLRDTIGMWKGAAR